MDVLFSLRQIATAFVLGRFGSEYIFDAPVMMINWLSTALILRVVLAVFSATESRRPGARPQPMQGFFLSCKGRHKIFSGEKKTLGRSAQTL